MKLYNTPHKTVEDIQPLNPGQVTVYTCGPTVYDYLHVGNWFTFIRYDLLVRALAAEDLHPRWVMNITDVGHLVSDADEGEDKLEKGAQREGKTAWEIADFYTQYFLDGLQRLNITQPSELPRATDHIPEQIQLVQQLESKGYTYVIDDGVYFDTSKFPAYADFAQLNLSEQEEGARVAANQQKRNPSDFALWKLSPAGQQRDMEWDSPWGIGFPGWHLECSAMSMKYLGPTLDVHAGGIDHIPVHHTNEIAQSEAATGAPFARTWMHANHILVNGQKISKSLQNGITLEDIEEKGFDPLDVRMLAIMSHYRSQSQFSWDTLTEAQTIRKRLGQWADLQFQGFTSSELAHNYETASQELQAVLAHDLNTPEALAIINGMTHRVEELGADSQAVSQVAQLVDTLLGLDLTQRQDTTTAQKQLLTQRQQARDDKEWATSDQLRDRLAAEGIGVRDAAYGQVWFRL